MGIADLLRLVTQGAFVLIAVVTLVDFLRQRDQPRLDIALMFGALGVIVLIQGIQSAIGQPLGWMATAGAIVLLAQPYLLLRLVQHFRAVPRMVDRVAVGGMIVSWGILLAFGSQLPAPLTLLIVASFVAVEGYAALAFVRGALGTVGVTHWRLVFAATGSGLLAAAILLAGISAIVPAVASIADSLTQVLGVLAALSYYTGFAPPRWLRQVWQLFEVQRFLHEAAGRTAAERAAAAPTHLCATAPRAAGGLAAVVALWDETAHQLTTRASSGPRALSGPLLAQAGAIGQAWRERQPVVARTSRDFGPDGARLAASVEAGALLAVPIASQEHYWGLLVVLLRRGPLFAADDLALLMLLAEQSAIALDYGALLTAQQALVERLRQRTAQLEATNGELEAFSYSVSHDLRAPLRSIDGFSQVLLEDYAEVLDASGQDCLQRVRAAAQRMGELIDDLLQLSRVTRSELRIESVDLSALAHGVAADLRQREPDRAAEFAIAPGVVAKGDSGLLRVLLENLLGNAWKFTSTHACARITFGISQRDGQKVYFVRDDGVGFEMAYAEKLFGAFQRLHAMKEFEGTGIGLATVKRIVQRHDGQVWAEGAVEHGATFSFTLGYGGHHAAEDHLAGRGQSRR